MYFLFFKKTFNFQIVILQIILKVHYFTFYFHYYGCKNVKIRVACNKKWRYPTKQFFEEFYVMIWDTDR